MRYIALALMAAPAVAAAPIAFDLADRCLTTRVVVHLEGKEPVVIRVTSSEARDHGTTSRGEITETGEPALLMRWKDGRFGGMLAHRGRVYRLERAADGSGRIRGVTDLAPDSSETQIAAASGDEPARKHASLLSRSMTSQMRRRPRAVENDLPAGGDRLGAPIASPMSPAQRQELAARKTTIDVMVLYTRKVATQYVDLGTDLIAQAIEEANASFRNSGIGNIALRLAHSQAVDYAETDRDHFNHLYRMVDGVGAFQNIRALRNQHKADVVILIVDDASGCGLATRVGADAEEAFAVVHHACAALMYSIPHEIGHIIGARHDAATDHTASAVSYGHGHVATKWRDIMSYSAGCNGCPRLPVWSNPTIKIKGEPAGTLLADNARLLLEQSGRVANFR